MHYIRLNKGIIKDTIITWANTEMVWQGMAKDNESRSGSKKFGFYLTGTKKGRKTENKTD